MGEGDTGGDSGWALRLRGNSLLRVYREDMVPLRRTPRSAQRQRHGSRRGLSGLRAGPQPAATPPGLSLRTLLWRLVPRPGPSLRSRRRQTASREGGGGCCADELGGGPSGGRRRRPPGATPSAWSRTASQRPRRVPAERHRHRHARAGAEVCEDAARRPVCPASPAEAARAEPRAPSPPSCRHSRPDSLSGMLERGQGQRLTFSSQAGCHLQATCRRKGRGRLPGSPSAGPSAHVPDREDGALPAAGL